MAETRGTVDKSPSRPWTKLDAKSVDPGLCGCWRGAGALALQQDDASIPFHFHPFRDEDAACYFKRTKLSSQHSARARGAQRSAGPVDGGRVWTQLGSYDTPIVVVSSLPGALFFRVAERTFSRAGGAIGIGSESRQTAGEVPFSAAGQRAGPPHDKK